MQNNKFELVDKLSPERVIGINFDLSESNIRVLSHNFFKEPQR